MADITAIPRALRASRFLMLRPGTKRPAQPNATLEHGALWDASTDTFLARGDQRVGIFMAGRYVVLDADLKQDFEDDGSGSQVVVITRTGNDDVARLIAEAGLDGLPATVKIRTQGGGTHWYFEQNPECRVTQRRIGYLDVRAAPNAYCAIGAGYQLLEDAPQVATLPLELARVIMTAQAAHAEVNGEPEQNGHATSAYGDKDSAFNNWLTQVKGSVVKDGCTNDEANAIVWRLNEISRDPITREKFDETVGRDKGWVPGLKLSTDMLAWVEEVASRTDGTDEDTFFAEKIRTEPKYQTMAIDIAFRRWVTDKLKEAKPPEESTWDEIDIGPLLGDEAANTIFPDCLTREDGQHLCYTASTLWSWGEPGHGKTILCLLWAAQEIQHNRHVIWLDFEHQLQGTIQKLLTLFNCTKNQLREFLHVRQPNDQLLTHDRKKLLLEVERLEPALIVMDACNDFLNLQGGRHNDVDPIANLDQKLLQPFKRLGAACAVIDHVAKSEEARGWPVNSGHKKAATESGFQIRRVAPFTRDVPGYSKIISQKDRNGTFPDGSTIGYLVVSRGRAWLACEPPISVMSAGAQEAVKGEVIKSQDQTSIARRLRILQLISDRPGTLTRIKAAGLLEDKNTSGYSAKSFDRTITDMLKTDVPELVEGLDGTLSLDV
jgi:hypothetical protein